ncbi:PREDICTED: P2X purinoceptor 7 [Tinamus guttatus]|uniref:P2X purinoceptor 7 n=1 Tax=Tinamus guttatus TaxID=94827 RepID=UPI00052EB043|nr:PREDICTED: P2X purinoceptor 7 [Tinamus guttatus]
MGACGFPECLGSYSSSKDVDYQSHKYAFCKWICHLAVVVYVGYTLLFDKRYQEKDSVISSVHTKVKGVAQTDKWIWDTAEYTIPMQGVDSFFVITNVIITENQVQSRCAEYPFANNFCSSDSSCIKDSVDQQSNGIRTGRCVKYNATVKTCEIIAWCPVESEKTAPVPAVLESAENFTVLIKNNIHFPKFDYTRQNIPQNFNASCTFNKKTSPLCPIFRLGDILQAANQNFSEMAVEGGIIGIEINWDCNLDFNRCSLQYGFRRLDDKSTSKQPGFNFRFAKHYKQSNGVEQRTLIKAYGIRFDVLVFGTAGRFDFIELMMYIGSMISYFGLVRDLFIMFMEPLLATFVIDFYITYCSCCKSPVRIYHYKKKYETVQNPRRVMYVSHVDKPHVVLIKEPLKTSLQDAEGKVVEVRTCTNLWDSLFRSHPEKFSDCVDCCTHRSNKDSVTNGYDMQPFHREMASSQAHLLWCHCGECQNTNKRHEQLCCRSKEGECITTSPLFERLVLSRDNLRDILLYKEPFLDLNNMNANDKLRRCAFKQYIRWRFGSFDLEDRAVIPSCCRWKIRNIYPKCGGNYTGFKAI